jgi:hypothetical protein
MQAFLNIHASILPMVLTLFDKYGDRMDSGLKLTQGSAGILGSLRLRCL